jgi:hypothetical protein
MVMLGRNKKTYLVFLSQDTNVFVNKINAPTKQQAKLIVKLFMDRHVLYINKYNIKLMDVIDLNEIFTLKRYSEKLDTKEDELIIEDIIK